MIVFSRAVARPFRNVAFGIAEKDDAPDRQWQQQPAQPGRQQPGQQIDAREQGNERKALAMNRQTQAMPVFR